MLRLEKTSKLNIKPIYVTLHHDCVLKAPCRMGKGFELSPGNLTTWPTRELIQGANQSWRKT